MSLSRYTTLAASLVLLAAPVVAFAQQGEILTEPLPENDDAAAATEAAPAEAAPEPEDGEAPPPIVKLDTAVLRGLDKLTGAVVVFDAAVGAEARFERLRLLVETCQTRGPEHAVFLHIYDSGRPEGLDLVFSGWMFASSPALSSLDHPRYDIWLQSCKTS